MRKLLFFLVIAQSLLFVNPTLAIGIGVRPKELVLTGEGNQDIKTEILVTNTGKEPALYQVYPDELKERIMVKPSDFRLDPQGSQIVTISVQASPWKGLTTDLSVVGRPLGVQSLATASGVKVPLIIEAAKLPWWWLALGGGLIILICPLVLFVLKFKKKKTYENLG